MPEPKVLHLFSTILDTSDMTEEEAFDELLRQGFTHEMLNGYGDRLKATLERKVQTLKDHKG
jgi:hypothetical protein